MNKAPEMGLVREEERSGEMPNTSQMTSSLENGDVISSSLLEYTMAWAFTVVIFTKILCLFHWSPLPQSLTSFNYEFLTFFLCFLYSLFIPISL